VRVRSLIFTAVLLVLCAGGAGAQPAPDQFFETKIRPVLSTRCYACHSVEAGSAEGRALLSTNEVIFWP